ncbi:AraC family transcriptional regulator [Streptomyces sp. NPDC006552]|uniref:AraC family transcriptional regulator n=1 Tax=Streptomyces sp. NPDC006552 TaxID=3157179 RepID=UPI0033BEF482
MNQVCLFRFPARTSHIDTVSHFIRQARVEASLDKRCLLGASTRMDVAAMGKREAPFHVLLDGECRLLVGSQVLELRPGDAVIIPSGRPHRITTERGGSRISGTAETVGAAFATARSAQTREAVIDLFCGHYTFGCGAGAILLGSLPDPVHVSFGQSSDSDEVLRMLSALMRGEAHREGEGTAAVLSALCTVLLTMVLRTSRGPASAMTLWTAAGDARIAGVVERIVADPGADWPIERLSRLAAMSRATFIRRFGRSTGVTVGAFLTRVRMMAAAELLLSGDANVAGVAEQVGYRSESAFSRSFRRAVGTTPARFRRSGA